MKSTIKSMFISAFVILQLAAVACYAASPVGYWKTIDDKTGTVKSVVKITNSSGRLYGKIVKLYPGALTICSACKGSEKGKPTMGMTVMRGLKQDSNNPNNWDGGKIMDPKTGKVYRCKLSVSADGQTLTVRGYIGISLLGRSQTWKRVSKP